MSGGRKEGRSDTVTACPAVGGWPRLVLPCGMVFCEAMLAFIAVSQTGGRGPAATPAAAEPASACPEFIDHPLLLAPADDLAWDLFDAPTIPLPAFVPDKTDPPAPEARDGAPADAPAAEPAAVCPENIDQLLLLAAAGDLLEAVGGYSGTVMPAGCTAMPASVHVGRVPKAFGILLSLLAPPADEEVATPADPLTAKRVVGESENIDHSALSSPPATAPESSEARELARASFLTSSAPPPPAERGGDGPDEGRSPVGGWCPRDSPTDTDQWAVPSQTELLSESMNPDAPGVDSFDVLREYCMGAFPNDISISDTDIGCVTSEPDAGPVSLDLSSELPAVRSVSSFSK